jgi:hypothetical protein
MRKEEREDLGEDFCRVIIEKVDNSVESELEKKALEDAAAEGLDKSHEEKPPDDLEGIQK